jgi:PilZ domain
VTDQDPSPKPNRKAPRRKVLKDGKIVSPDLHGSLDVRIRDLSPSGALIEVPLETELPDTFGFLVVSESKIYPAAKRWRRGNRLGMEFTGPAKVVNLRKW